MTIHYSPGPWAIESSLSSEFRFTRYITDLATHIVAEVRPVHDDDHVEIANARLMAAAPEMLDALINLVRTEREHGLVGHEQATAAIATATGELA
jgi:hypothetical protein